VSTAEEHQRGLRVVRGVWTESEAEALLREAGPDGGAVSPSGRALLQRLGTEADLLDLDDAPVGSAWLSRSGSLSASFLIHVVIQGRDEPVTETSVRTALRNGLRRAAEFGIESVALPPLGVGAGKLDHERSAVLVVETLAEHLEQGGAPTVFEIVVASDYEEEVFGRAAAAFERPDVRA